MNEEDYDIAVDTAIASTAPQATGIRAIPRHVAEFLVNLFSRDDE